MRFLSLVRPALPMAEVRKVFLNLRKTSTLVNREHLERAPGRKCPKRSRSMNEPLRMGCLVMRSTGVNDIDQREQRWSRVFSSCKETERCLLRSAASSSMEQATTRKNFSRFCLCPYRLPLWLPVPRAAGVRFPGRSWWRDRRWRAQTRVRRLTEAE